MVKSSKMHFNVKEKEAILKKEVYLVDSDVKMIAEFIDGFPFEMIKKMSKAFAIIAKGK